MPLFVKSLKTKPRKSVSMDMPDYDLGREASNDEGREEVEANEEEGAAIEEENEESDEIPLLGHQGKMVIQSVNNMLHDHHQVINKIMDKQDKWHKNMYETLATTTSSLAHKQDMLWESVASLRGCMKDFLAHPSMQKRNRGIVPPPMMREMQAWEEIPVIQLPYPPPQGNGGQD